MKPYIAVLGDGTIIRDRLLTAVEWHKADLVLEKEGRSIVPLKARHHGLRDLKVRDDVHAEQLAALYQVSKAK